MSKKKAAGKTRQNIRREGRRLGLKISQDQAVTTGMTLIKQRGTTYKAGDGVGVSKDHTIFALRDGKVKFGTKLGRTIVSVV